MNVLLITHTLQKTGVDYTSFFDAVKNNSDYWWHYFPTTWIVATSHSADEYAKLLYPYMDKDDHLFVVRITKEQQGWMPQDAWEWLNDKQY